jgi:hypothetical protein
MAIQMRKASAWACHVVLGVALTADVGSSTAIEVMG